MNSNSSLVIKWRLVCHKGYHSFSEQLHYQPQKRLLALALLSVCTFAMANNQLSCPIWNAGCACPTCGITRATQSLLTGNLTQAFSYQAFLGYWLFLAGAIGLSFISYIVGFSQHPDAIGKKVLDAIPASFHYCIWLISLLVNWYQYGINPEGWLIVLVSSFANKISSF